MPSVMKALLRTQSPPQPHSLLPAHRAVLQRKCACGGTAGPRGECETCRQKKLQRRSQSPPAQSLHSEAPPIVHEVLRSSGQPLDAASRNFFTPRFGHDFSHVRVHTDGRAAESASAVDALAYTVGPDVVFGQGQYRPHTAGGRSILAHELTHVVQQGNAPKDISAPLEVGTAGDVYERDADATAHLLASDTPLQRPRSIPSSAVQRLQRQTKQDTHAGLFELTKHDRLGGPTFAPQAQYDVKIEFLPYDIVDCTEVALTQDSVAKIRGTPAFSSAADRARALTAAEGTEGVGIDRLSGSTSPFYGAQNAGGTSGNAHFGSHPKGGVADPAWLTDKPGVNGVRSSRTAGDALSFQFETCAICSKGNDQGSYYGCVSWGYDIDATNTFNEAPFSKISRGTPSADFLSAAKKWNDQTAPVATDDLPLPTHQTNNKDMTRAELDAEITSLTAKLLTIAGRSFVGITAGQENTAQLSFELRVLRDIRDSIAFNEAVALPPALNFRQIQKTVDATPGKLWTYEMIQKLKIYQAENGIKTSGQLDAPTLRRLQIDQLGDFLPPSERTRSTA